MTKRQPNARATAAVVRTSGLDVARLACLGRWTRSERRVGVHSAKGAAADSTGSQHDLSGAATARTSRNDRLLLVDHGRPTPPQNRGPAARELQWPLGATRRFPRPDFLADGALADVYRAWLHSPAGRARPRS